MAVDRVAVSDREPVAQPKIATLRMPRNTLHHLISSDILNHHRSPDLLVTELGHVDYQETLHAMQSYAMHRSPEHPDQIWLLEHHPVYTQGRLSSSDDILGKLPHPLVNTDRGGQITYHGPGQLIIYFLIHLANTRQLSQLMQKIEAIAIHYLTQHGISAYTTRRHRGVYVQQQKIASVGLRIKNNHTYHGMAINVDMDLSPFQHIHPCGRKQNMCQVNDFTHVSMPNTVQSIRTIITNIWKN